MLFKQAMVGEGAEAEFGLPNKRRHLLSTIFRGVSSARSLQDYMPSLESIIRKWVKEEVDRAIDFFLRSSNGQVKSIRSRNLQLQFLNSLSHTIFTGKSIVSVDTGPIKLALFDCASGKIVTTGAYSTIKVDTLVLDGDFTPDCGEDGLEKDFDSKVVQTRRRKKPLITGEATIFLKDGIGYISDVSFTDNSSWTRSGRFRLGVKAHSSFDETNIREGISNSFKVKDHRGESYKKHYPPSLDDDVWRLVKIAKDGASHNLLTQFGISSVQDFLRSYNINQRSLRAVLRNVSDKKWETIIKHATTCILDDKKYIYRTAEGTLLVLNSIYKVVGVTFDGQTYHSCDSNSYQMKMVEDMKQHGYKNIDNWIHFEVGPYISPQNANFHAKQGMQMNTYNPTISDSYSEVVQQDNNSFELGESSQIQGLNLTFNNFMMNDSSERFYVGEQTWPVWDKDVDPQVSLQDFIVDRNF